MSDTTNEERTPLDGERARDIEERTLRNRERAWLRRSLIDTEQVLRFIILRRADLDLAPYQDSSVVSAWGEIKPLLWEMQDDIERLPYERLRRIGMTGSQLSLKLNSFDEAFDQLRQRLASDTASGLAEFDRSRSHGEDTVIFGAASGDVALEPPNFDDFGPFKGVVKRVVRWLLNLLKHVNSILGSLKKVLPHAEMVKEFKECLENLIETRQLASEA